ncbi:MAG: tetratricopeptide repeat protein [Zoogloeaceae bacterium]|jgi:tetratricopeptide (TPR) repeat protein|nr:tetratricopeptide repeat protein [Zoogloeaceae bacterium]
MSAGKGRLLLALFLLLCAVTAVYWPGLRSGFLFDDLSSIVANEHLALANLDGATLWAAAWSGNAGPLGRPVSLLSFALNHYVGGLDPHGYKWVNLVIHLCNTVLVFGLSWVILLNLARREEGGAYARVSGRESRILWGALMAAAFWGLHPLNLTSVLYVVQRMTSLSALFGFAALLVYGLWRTLPVRHGVWQNLGVAVVLICLLALSVLSKESGFLFLPLSWFMEVFIFRGRLQGRKLHVCGISWLGLCGWFGAVCALVFVWKMSGFVRPEGFWGRDFTAWERLMTEGRVLFYYLRLFFFPSLSELALYHDDFVISRSLLHPTSTAVAAFALVFLTCLAFSLARKIPILFFAWVWFLIAHALESTVVSLELVHEHRNYFATAGFAMLLSWFVFRLPPQWRRHGVAAFSGVLLLCAFITWQRASLWSNEEARARFEAVSHPDSPRAQFQLAQVYRTLWQQTNDATYLEKARTALAQARQDDGRHEMGHGGWFGAVFLAFQANEAPEANLLSELKARLREKPVYNSNSAFLRDLVDCQIRKACHLGDGELLELLDAALENPRASSMQRSVLRQLIARHALSEGRAEAAEEHLRRALREAGNVEGYISLARTLAARGRLREALEALTQAERLDRNGVWRARIQQDRARFGS